MMQWEYNTTKFISRKLKELVMWPGEIHLSCTYNSLIMTSGTQMASEDSDISVIPSNSSGSQTRNSSFHIWNIRVMWFTVTTYCSRSHGKDSDLSNVQISCIWKSDYCVCVSLLDLSQKDKIKCLLWNIVIHCIHGIYVDTQILWNIY